MAAARRNTEAPPLRWRVAVVARHTYGPSHAAGQLTGPTLHTAPPTGRATGATATALEGNVVSPLRFVVNVLFWLRSTKTTHGFSRNLELGLFPAKLTH